jgi:hypothetical protein
MDIKVNPNTIINQLSSRVNELTQENILLRSIISELSSPAEDEDAPTYREGQDADGTEEEN